MKEDRDLEVTSVWRSDSLIAQARLLQRGIALPMEFPLLLASDLVNSLTNVHRDTFDRRQLRLGIDESVLTRALFAGSLARPLSEQHEALP